MTKVVNKKKKRIFSKNSDADVAKESEKTSYTAVGICSK
jgi:hypothetical protein